MDLEVVRTKEKLFGVPSYQLMALHPFASGRFALSGGWVGKIEHCLCDVTVQFSDGSVCSIARCTLRELIPWDLEPDDLDELLEIDQTMVGFFPGQKVRAAPSVWTAAKWIRGQYNNKKHREAIVVFVQASAIAVHWFTTWLTGDKINPPNFMCSPSQLQVLDYYANSKFRVGDHVVVDWPNLRAAHKKPPTSFRCPPNPLMGVQLQLTAQTQQSLPTSSELSKGPSPRPREPQQAESSSSSAATAARPSGRFNFGFPKMLSQSANLGFSRGGGSSNASPSQPARTSSGSTIKSALQAEKEKKKQQKNQARNCARILRTYTLLDVQWPDGTVELHRPSLEFHSRPGSLELFPDDFVVLLPTEVADVSAEAEANSIPISGSLEASSSPRTSSDAVPLPRFGRQGVVLRVDIAESMCEVRWLDNGEIQHVSLYSITKHPQFDFTLGDTVMRIPNGSVSSLLTAAPTAANGPQHSPPRQGSLDGKEQTSLASNQGIGQVVDIFDGRITVSWSDGTKSTVPTDTLFVIDESDYVEEEASTIEPDHEDGASEEDEEDEEEDAEEEEELDHPSTQKVDSMKPDGSEDLEENESESTSSNDGPAFPRPPSSDHLAAHTAVENGARNDNDHASSSSSSLEHEEHARSDIHRRVGSHSTESGSRANSLRTKGARKKGGSDSSNIRIGVAGAVGKKDGSPRASGKPLWSITDDEDSRRHSRDEDEESIASLRNEIESHDALARSETQLSSSGRDGPSSSSKVSTDDQTHSAASTTRSQSKKSGRSVKVGSPAGRPSMFLSALRKNSIGSLEDSETSEASQSQSDSVSRHETASERAKQIEKIRKRMERMRLLGSVDESDQSGALSESDSGDDVVTQDQLDEDESAEDDDEVFHNSQADDDEDTNSETSASVSASASLNTPGESLLAAVAVAEQRDVELSKLASHIGISVVPVHQSSDRDYPPLNNSQRSGSGSSLVSLHSPATQHRRSPSGNAVGVSGLQALRSVTCSVASAEFHRFLSHPVPGNPKHIHKRVRKDLKLIRSTGMHGIWVNSYEDRVDLLSSLICGAPGTPYHLTIHSFDLLLSEGFPDQEAPEIMYHSLVRPPLSPLFNEDGSICLSLLSLWHRRGSGDASRWWNPDQANLTQVLLSIQGLILGVQFPLFLQQPRLQQHKSKESQRLAILYNERILLLSLQHIIRTLTFPHKHFDSLIRDFYRMNRDTIFRLADILLPLFRGRKAKSFGAYEPSLTNSAGDAAAASALLRQFGITYDPPPTQGFLVVFEKLMLKLRPILTEL